MNSLNFCVQTLFACSSEYFSVSPVAVTNLSNCSDSSIAGLLSDPLTVLVYSNYEPGLTLAPTYFTAMSNFYNLGCDILVS